VVAVDGAPVVGTALPFVDADKSPLAIEARTSFNVEVNSPVGRCATLIV